jgi:hypothetical protein
MSTNTPDWVLTEAIPILPKAGLFLESGWEGDGRRFARLFAQTWRRLPLGVRRALRRHWRAQDDAPWIVYHRAYYYGEAGNYGSCGYEGYRLWFDPSLLDALPDAAVQYLVAHELAHAYQWATGRFTPAERDRYALDEYGSAVFWLHDAERVKAATEAFSAWYDIEDDADWLAIDAWGFDESGLPEEARRR